MPPVPSEIRVKVEYAEARHLLEAETVAKKHVMEILQRVKRWPMKLVVSDCAFHDRMWYVNILIKQDAG